MYEKWQWPPEYGKEVEVSRGVGWGGEVILLGVGGAQEWSLLGPLGLGANLKSLLTLGV